MITQLFRLRVCAYGVNARFFYRDQRQRVRGSFDQANRSGMTVRRHEKGVRRSGKSCLLVDGTGCFIDALIVGEAVDVSFRFIVVTCIVKKDRSVHMALREEGQKGVIFQGLWITARYPRHVWKSPRVVSRRPSQNLETGIEGVFFKTPSQVASNTSARPFVARKRLV